MSYNALMKKKLLLFLLPFVAGGCFNERGVSLRYYSECEEYYDVQGYYHKECDKNIVDYSDVKEAFRNPIRGSVQ